MSTILKELRLLEAEHASGAITADELEQRKADLVDDVPEVVALEVNEPEPPGQVHALPGFASWDTLLLWIIGATLSGAFVWMLTADTALALTMGITVLAAMTIKLFLQLED